VHGCWLGGWWLVVAGMAGNLQINGCRFWQGTCAPPHVLHRPIYGGAARMRGWMLGGFGVSCVRVGSHGWGCW